MGLARTNPNSGKWKVELRWTSTPSIDREETFTETRDKDGIHLLVHFKADFVVFILATFFFLSL